MHNWIRIYTEEKAGNLDYHGYIPPRGNRRGARPVRIKWPQSPPHCVNALHQLKNGPNRLALCVIHETNASSDRFSDCNGGPTNDRGRSVSGPAGRGRADGSDPGLIFGWSPASTRQLDD